MRGVALGARVIAGLIPCNSIADEILTDHPERLRALWIDSSNPAHSLPESRRFIDAMRACELTVVVDVAMTETAREADYVLPASSQYEKWECTFFTMEFPHNAFQLRAPLLEPRPGTLPEPEIYARLLRELGAVDQALLARLRTALTAGDDAFALALFSAAAADPSLLRLIGYVLYETLGPTLPEGARGAAILWGAAHLCALSHPDAVARAGFTGKGVTIVIFAFDGFHQSDLDKFTSTFALPRLAPEVVGGVPEEVRGELSMDLQVAHAIAPDARKVVVKPARGEQGTVALLAAAGYYLGYIHDSRPEDAYQAPPRHIPDHLNATLRDMLSGGFEAVETLEKYTVRLQSLASEANIAAQMARVTAQARSIIAHIGEEPERIRAARSFLVVHLHELRRIAAAYLADIGNPDHGRQQIRFHNLLADSEHSFTAQHLQLTNQQQEQLDTQIQVLRDQLKTGNQP